ncbi:Similar to Periodic tryptophan protein 2 homolog; acc. no. Q9C270 [Pyronema omphalodes CBS 100304]|uniref:Similar to Periodic tryptophan protein 2 homolog acc. no. Q9C270 n=1 Tax=Pyronema omphalodes (strain CBS 100304) TaxID=1076935 RepID=U4L264_PYROM|nr:Similar to Periodic tryptophan protein 2 homolog; acc. no. Q9C270 [Pyronema omphalodes CBS 100304]
MKVGFNFSNLLGTVYCSGNLVFTPDGNSLLSPVGNKVTCFDLVNNKSFTFGFEHRKNIARIALSPQGTLLLSVDEDGRAILTNFVRRTVLHHFNFKSVVHDIKFSSDGTHFAVACGRKTEVWRTPAHDEERDFAPFIKHREYTGHHDAVTHIEWSGDSRFFMTSSKDLTARVWSLNPEQHFVPTTLASHREAIIGAWFSKDQEKIYTVSKDGALLQWEFTKKPGQDYDDDDEMDAEVEERWYVVKRSYFNQNSAKVKCATFHKESNLLVVGFSTGVFGLYELPEFNTIHTLSISQNGIDFVTINKTGEWLAFGASKLGQLLVWEWQSESYVIKQQGHYDAMNALTYSPDGNRIVTAADDGRIKVWDATSGFCIVTFTEHTAGVTAVQFSVRNLLFTASLDGSVRAWDLIRYRNFKTFTAPSRLQFSSLAVDSSGEIVCAGSLDSFDIHIWNVQTGQLLETLSGHDGPISSLSFAPDGSSLVSGSWDRTVRIWSIFTRTQTSEPLQQQADVLCVIHRPDSKQLTVSTLDGQLTFWEIENAEQVGHVDGKKDVSGGRKVTDRVTAANNAATKHFNTIAYSADGTCVLAGGNSMYVCLYDVASGSLIKKFTISRNLSLDGTQEFLNSKSLTEGGVKELFDDQGEASDLEDRIDRSLPGAKRGDLSERKARPEIRVTGLSFSPTGRSFACATTEGLMIYSLDNTMLFDPFDLDIDVTPDNTRYVLKEDKDYLKALVMSFRLNEKYLIHEVYESTPVEDIPLVVGGLPTVYLGRLLRFITLFMEDGPHLEFGLVWIESLFESHGKWIKENKAEVEAEMRRVVRCLKRVQNEVARLGDENGYTLNYLLSQPRPAPEGGEKGLKFIEDTNGESESEDVDMEGADDEWKGVSDSE